MIALYKEIPFISSFYSKSLCYVMCKHIGCIYIAPAFILQWAKENNYTVRTTSGKVGKYEYKWSYKCKAEKHHCCWCRKEKVSIDRVVRATLCLPILLLDRRVNCRKWHSFSTAFLLPWKKSPSSYHTSFLSYWFIPYWFFPYNVNYSFLWWNPQKNVKFLSLCGQADQEYHSLLKINSNYAEATTIPGVAVLIREACSVGCASTIKPTLY